MSTPHGEPAASSNDPIASGPIPEATSDNSHSSPIAPPEQTHRVPQPLHLQTTTYAHASSLREPSETIVDQSDQQQSDAWFLGFDLALNEDALRSVDRLQSDQAASSAPHLEDWDISFGDDLQFPDLLSSAHTMVTGPFQGVEQSISRQDNGVSRDSGLQIRPLSSPTDELAIRHDERPYYNYHRAPSSSDYGSQLRPNNPHLLSTQTLPNRLISSMSENIHTSPTSNDRVPSSEGHTEGSRLLTATRSQQEQSIHSTHGIEQRPSQPDHSETGISPQVELVLSKNEKSKKPRRRPSKRERSRFSSPKRRQVAERRQQGACDTCRKRKVTCHRPSLDAPDCPAAGSGRRRTDSAPPIPNFTSIPIPPVQRHRAVSDMAGGSHPPFPAHQAQAAIIQFQNNHMPSDMTQTLHEAMEPMLEGFGYGINGHQRYDRYYPLPRPINLAIDSVAEVDEEPANVADSTLRTGRDETVQSYNTSFNFNTVPLNGSHATGFPSHAATED